MTFKNLLYGDYILKETGAPEGYVVGITDGPTIEVDANPSQVTIENKKIIRAVELTKKDQETGDVLAGATFELQKKIGDHYQTIANLTTNDQGVIYINNLEPGDYQFVELLAPDGYQKGTEPIPFTIKDKQTEVTQVTAENFKLGSVELIKYNEDDANETLENAEFKLLRDNDSVVHPILRTDVDGKIFVPNLEPGKYKFIETKAPDYFQLDATSLAFEVKPGETATVAVEAPNELIMGKVLLTKMDKDETDITLEGAEFKLVNEQDEVVQENLTTDKNGQISVDHLKPGTYRFIETNAPEHYQLAEQEIEFTIERSKTEVDVEVVTVEAENELIPGSVELVKVDGDNNELTLEGAEFELQDADGNTLQEGLATNDEGKLVVSDLKPGAYQFVETEAPFGYDLDETPITFTIEKGQTEVATVTAENELSTGSVELIKVDKDNNELTLEGAEFELQDADGNTLQETLITNNEGKLVVNDLKPGKYQFVETKAPEGYLLDSSPTSFTIQLSQRDAAHVIVENQMEAKDLGVPSEPEEPVDPGHSVSGESHGDGEKLPQTATAMFNYILVGLIALITGLFVLARRREK